MFGFFKKAKMNEQIMYQEEENRKKQFSEYLELNKNKNSTYESMYVIFNELDIDLVELSKRHNLFVDFDFVEKDNYYEVMIESQNSGKKGLYLTVGTEKGEYFATLTSDGDSISTDNLTKNHILKSLIDEIKLHYRN